MELPRCSGILLHPTSLPGPHGIGDLGAEAYRFADFLYDHKQRIWQVLPLGPTGYGDSPYQCFSAFAGNPMLIDMRPLRDAGLLSHDDLAPGEAFPRDFVDYGAVIPWKRDRLRRAYDAFSQDGGGHDAEAFAAFRETEAAWLDEFALFMALKEVHDYAAWTTWEPALVRREPAAIARARAELADRIEAQMFYQFIFFRQWEWIRSYCNARGIRIVGDIPIYVAHDSADVWAHRELFKLDDAGEPTVVGGVPPDYFSKRGQRWGNPIFEWDYHKRTGYTWWIERVHAALHLFDVVRIDHFRGFEAYWEVPARQRTAVKGEWAPGPGASLFKALQKEFGHDLPIIAENLGLITEDVEKLRKRFKLPGMAVMQFGFGHNARTSDYPPHTFTRDLVAYTGTHDNDTVVGWWRRMRRNKPVSNYVRDYVGLRGRDVHWAFIRELMASVADTTVFPLQDVLGLDNRARMNRPGRPAGNWRWRLLDGMLTPNHGERLLGLTELFGRASHVDAAESGETPC